MLVGMLFEVLFHDAFHALEDVRNEGEGVGDGFALILGRCPFEKVLIKLYGVLIDDEAEHLECGDQEHFLGQGGAHVEFEENLDVVVEVLTAVFTAFDEDLDDCGRYFNDFLLGHPRFLTEELAEEGNHDVLELAEFGLDLRGDPVFEFPLLAFHVSIILLAKFRRYEMK